MKRRDFLLKTSSALSVALTACGGGASSAPSPAAEPPPAAPPPASPPPPDPTPTDPTPGTAAPGLPTLTLHASQSGTFPYLATAFPLPGAVPSGKTVDSADDPTLSASTISRWPDGSAAVVILAGQTSVSAGSSREISLRSVERSVSPLTAARVGQLINSIEVDASGVGSATLTSFDSPGLVWWSNDQVVCCRYRLPLGGTALEAVIDVHAFASNRAFVEVVIENGKLVSGSPTKPATASYSGTVTIDGKVVASLPAHSHEAFRAVYCSAWVGGDPGIEVTHDVAQLQQHPLLFKLDQVSSRDLQSDYGGDAYTPWSTGRIRTPGMGSGGDHPMIGALTQWDTQYLQSGSRYARRAVLSNALAGLSFNVNYRDSGTGVVPTLDQTAGRTRAAGTWPETATEPSWEVSHHPATGLMAFICQPSPCFIEIAQKVALWNATWSDPTGLFNKWFSTRGVAWCMRSLAHAMFLTPTMVTSGGSGLQAWRTGGANCMVRNMNRIDGIRTVATNKLGTHWGGDYNEAHDEENDEATINPYGGFQSSIWMHHWLAGELHKIANAKLLSGASQTLMETIADWACTQPVRQVNESTAGEWRFHGKMTTIGKNNFNSKNGLTLLGGGLYTGADPGETATWGEIFAFYRGAPPALSGPWVVGDGAYPAAPDYTGPAWSTDPVANADLNYATHFCSALCYAVERGVPGAATAWATVNANITGLAAWRAGFAADPRQGNFPRNR